MNRLLGYKALQAIIGKTISKITGLEDESECVSIEFADGTKIDFWHQQDCCEYVRLYDYELTVKDAEKLIGGVVNDAREDGDGKEPDDYDDGCDSETWTFYNINTSKGCINMRWLGESNGYYSEEVNIELLTPA